jgi:hypothetical protein
MNARIGTFSVSRIMGFRGDIQVRLSLRGQDRGHRLSADARLPAGAKEPDKFVGVCYYGQSAQNGPSFRPYCHILDVIEVLPTPFDI